MVARAGEIVELDEDVTEVCIDDDGPANTTPILEATMLVGLPVVEAIVDVDGVVLETGMICT